VSVEETKRELARLTERLTELNGLGAKLYEDRLVGNIDIETFKALSAAADTERIAKQDERDRMEKVLVEAERQTANVKVWLESVRMFLSLEKPDNKTLSALIERIEVGPNEGTRKEKKQTIKIVYRFAG
jgi:hypothetical protein